MVRGGEGAGGISVNVETTAVGIAESGREVGLNSQQHQGPVGIYSQEAGRAGLSEGKVRENIRDKGDFG